ncbi:hypothetical protein WJX73_002495 [Symbiochloris irregularis]|uniref:Uncharacterized protein n=1 Tax=Symbiochloris irregularis TaxID=706552 RepID=A0AAW1PEG7_9CHLO
MAAHAGAYLLCQQTQDQSSSPPSLQAAHAEMQAAVGNLALMKFNAESAMQDVLRSQRAQLEYMQLSQMQQGMLVQQGLALFADQRALADPRRSLAGPIMAVLRPASHLSLELAALDPLQLGSIVDAILKLLSSEQILRMQSLASEDAILPSLYLKLMLLCHAWLKPRAPSSPSLRYGRDPHTSPRRCHKRPRSPSPEHGKRSARRLAARPEHLRPQQSPTLLPDSLQQTPTGQGAVLQQTSSRSSED